MREIHTLALVVRDGTVELLRGKHSDAGAHQPDRDATRRKLQHAQAPAQMGGVAIERGQTEQGPGGLAHQYGIEDPAAEMAQPREPVAGTVALVAMFGVDDRQQHLPQHEGGQTQHQQCQQRLADRGAPELGQGALRTVRLPPAFEVRQQRKGSHQHIDDALGNVTRMSRPQFPAFEGTRPVHGPLTHCSDLSTSSGTPVSLGLSQPFSKYFSHTCAHGRP